MSKFPVRDRSDIFVDKENILHYFQKTVETLENLEQLKEKVARLYASPGAPMKALFDQRGVDFLSQMPFRERYIELSALGKDLKKIAVLTDNRLQWILLTFNLNAGGKFREAAQNIRPFFSEEEAMKWLRGD